MLTQSQLTETAAQLYRDALVASLAQGSNAMLACSNADLAVRNYRRNFPSSPACPMVPTRPGKWWRKPGDALPPRLVEVNGNVEARLAPLGTLVWQGVLVKDDGTWRGPLLAPGESWAPEDDARFDDARFDDARFDDARFDDARDNRLVETPTEQPDPHGAARPPSSRTLPGRRDRSRPERP